MSRGKLLVILLLVVSPLLTLTPMVASQTYTTVTSVNIVTTTGTYTQMSAYAVGTTTATKTSTDIIVSETFIAKPPPGRLYCMNYWYPAFDAHAGEHIQVKTDASQNVAFWILTDDQFKAWRESKECDPSEAGIGTVLATNYVRSYTFDFVPQKDGKYNFLFAVAQNTDTTISLTASRQLVQMVTLSIQATTSNLLLITATRTTTSVSTGTVAQMVPGLALDPLIMIGLLIVIVALIAAFVVYRSRFMSKKQQN